MSYDMWTSLNSILILRITAQFIDTNRVLQSLVLAMKEVVRTKTRENMCGYVIEVIIEYKLKDNLGYFVIDNAPDNDTLIDALLVSLRREFRL
jgi:hypothetical protein